MKIRESLEKAFEELPEEKERYEKMNKIKKFIFNTALYVFAFRDWYKKNVIPESYKAIHGLESEVF